MPQRNAAVDENGIPLPVVRLIPHPERSGYHIEFEDVTERVLHLSMMKAASLAPRVPEQSGGEVGKRHASFDPKDG